MFTLITPRKVFRVNPAYLAQFKIALKNAGVEVLATHRDEED